MARARCAKVRELPTVGRGPERGGRLMRYTFPKREKVAGSHRTRSIMHQSYRDAFIALHPPRVLVAVIRTSQSWSTRIALRKAVIALGPAPEVIAAGVAIDLRTTYSDGGRASRDARRAVR